MSDGYDRLREERPELFANPSHTAFTIEPTGRAEVRPSGLIYRDARLAFVRDPVRFRDGSLGGYIRLLPHGDGAAVLPVFDGRVVLVRHSRHATRGLHWEIPRGFADAGEDPQATARRELSEELHVPARRWRRLGLLHPDTGLSSGTTVLYWAELDQIPTEFDQLEGIDEVTLLDGRALDDLIGGGDLTDSFTLAAICYAERLGLPPFTGREPRPQQPRD